MSKTSELLFNFLRDILYNPSHASLDINALDEDYKLLGKGLLFLSESRAKQSKFIKAIANGDLSIEFLSDGDEFVAPLKALQASLRHMTWQSQQVAKGDYRQHVDFMGEFSEAFNSMTKQLDARQKALEHEIEAGRKKTRALEQSNTLLANITSNIPQMIVVMAEVSGEILYKNNSAQAELTQNGCFLESMQNIARAQEDDGEVEFFTEHDDTKRYFSACFYSLQWRGESAKAIVVNDVSVDKKHIKELEQYAYQDNLTGMHNRFSGMLIFQNWLKEKKQFTVCFVDLDNLKYVNDVMGHAEGDRYIIDAARLLKSFSAGTVASRLGGDEFMLLSPGITFEAAAKRAEALCKSLQQSHDAYFASMSFGIVEVCADIELTAEEILSLADERMYENKKSRKVQRG